MKILIADDNEKNCQLFEICLSAYGTVVIVNDGIDAVNAFRRACETGEWFDLVYLDCYLPKMDGLEALKAIRRIEFEHGIADDDRVQITMMSTIQDEALITRAHQNGCDSFVSQPGH